MSRERTTEIDRMRRAHDEYRALQKTVAAICQRNPRGLLPRPLFGQPRVKLRRVV